MTGEQEDLIVRIERADDEFVRLFAAKLDSPLQSIDLTMQQLKALLVIEQRDGASGQDLSEALGVGLAGVTGIVHRLAARRLVERHEDPRDRRVRRTYLTPAGRATLDDIRTAGRQSKRELLRRMAPQELRKMAEGLEALNDAAREDHG